MWGMAAGVSISSLMNTFTGTVTDIEKVERLTAEGTRTFAVTITLDNPGALTEGMTGAAWVTADSGEKLYPAVEGSLEYYNSKTLTAEAARRTANGKYGGLSEGERRADADYH